MEMLVNNFSGMLNDDVQYRIEWEILNDSMVLDLYVRPFGKHNFYYDSNIVVNYNQKNFEEKRRLILKDAFKKWGIKLLKEEMELLKTA
ncbi:hypothetical protein [Aquimarina sp. 2201CG5-10]|uniref:hypothetical protein n=1 Tax=Aquimarina callyspongiae TaxID=3098150 RepID=UPI002AB591C7|nr:hypothetical protein [Aquimarina sp. 2201CG5-10]MDY8137608.1 hypothetical protein [Aquimarina sp. 2201CG5-10]